jgi:hypothetical protein
MNEDNMLNLKEAAKLLHTTPGTLRKFVAERKIDALHTMPYGRGALRLYQESTVRSWTGPLAVFKNTNAQAGAKKRDRNNSMAIAAAMAKAPVPAITPPTEVIPFAVFESALTDALGRLRMEGREHNRLLLNAITKMTERFERIATDLGIKPS